VVRVSLLRPQTGPVQGAQRSRRRPGVGLRGVDEQRPPRIRSDSGARGATISANVHMGCDDRESPSIGANQRRRDVQANADSLTPHRIDSESTGAIASVSLARMNRSSAGAGKKLASPRWRQPLPTRWARRSAANAVITLPIMPIAPSGWWQAPRPATSPSIASRRRISARRARKSTTAANASTAARTPVRTALPRAGRRQKLSDSRSLG